LIYPVQGPVKLSDTICSSVQIQLLRNSKAFLPFSFVQMLVKDFKRSLTNFANSWPIQACMPQKAYQLNVNAVIMVLA